MLIHLRDEKYECRFFDRFDDEARRFEDRLRSEPMVVESIPWPRISFWQGYRHLESLSKKYVVVQMARKDSNRTYQLAAVEEASRIPSFSAGSIPYWIPSVEAESLSDQAQLLEIMRGLCLEHTSFMSLRAHAYVPGDPALNAAEKILRQSGFQACGRRFPARTRIIDLRPSIEEIFAEFPSKIRTKLRIKKPEEIRVEDLRSRGQIPDLQAALNDSFLRSTDQRQGYDFESLFRVLEKSPESAAAFGFFLSDDWNSPQAFISGVASAPLFEYTTAGSRSNARLRQFPFNYVLLWRLVEAAKARAALIFDMGGITEGSPEDPLAGISEFKRRFPGFEVNIGREGLLELRPAKSRLFSILQSLRGLFPGRSA
ncbi:MAG: hypothetical protein ACHQ2Z_04810 [Elusimicrobiota bacterium]